MLRLFFAVVGVAGMAFYVNVDENETISHLSNAIKEAKKNGFKKIDANELLLYRAAKGEEWLVSDSPDAVAMRDGVIPDAIQQMMRTIALDPAEKIGDVFGKAPKKKTIHILVKLLDTTTLRVNLPTITPAVNLNSCEDLLAFLESEMIEKDVVSANPSTLIEDILQFRLVGREKVVGEISNCFRSAIEGVKTKGLGPNKLEIPVCSGMSGLGKTRMLEESKRILCEEMKLDPRYVVNVIVPYSHNGYRPVSVEETMPIQASFSWRLLYQFFLMNNCSVAFSPWLQTCLPRNGNQLTLKNAVEAIELKVRSMRELNGGKLYLFLGIDGYQKIKTVRPSQLNSPLHELMGVIGEFVSVGSSVTLLPMFAGTELLAAGANKSIVHYQARQLPMTLLTMDQVFQLVDIREYYSGLLTYPEFLRNLFFLGGVPEWIVDYLTDLRFEWLLPGKAVPLTIIKDCYEATKAGYVMEYLRLLDPPGLVRLAAYAVSGTAIKENSPFDGKLKWSDLHESSVCLLLPRMHDDGYDVRVPYPLLAWTGEEAYKGTSVENDFADALGELYDRVDSVLFDVQPWQLWEEFGACFYAARINAFLLLGRSTVTLGELLPGAKMTARTSRISVNLVSSRVFQTTDQYGASIGPMISCIDDTERIDWTSGGWIVLSADNKAGVDIFFALKEAKTNKLIVFVDRRKRHNGPFQFRHAKKYFKQLDILPQFLEGSEARLVRGIMNCASSSNLGSYEMDHDCFLLPREENEKFHGTLSYHPACSPVVDVNSASLTALRSVLKGSKEAVDEAIEAILTKRSKPSGGFGTFEAFDSQVLKKLKVGIEENARIAP